MRRSAAYRDRVWAEASTQTVSLNGNEVCFLLKRSAKRRTIALKVDHFGLTVDAPLKSSERHVRRALQEQAAWILQKITAWSRFRVPIVQWVEGEKIPYFGRMLPLNIIVGQACRAKVWADLTGLVVTSPAALEPEQVAAKVIAWFHAEAQDYLPQRLAFLAQRSSIPCPRFLLSNAHTRWGSCNAKGDVRLNWRLMKASPAVIDYVVAHELAHLWHMDHSSAFWRRLAEICPSYEAARSELSLNDGLYRTF